MATKKPPVLLSSPPPSSDSLMGGPRHLSSTHMFVVDNQLFSVAGIDGAVKYDLVNDPSQGLGVPACSFSVENLNLVDNIMFQSSSERNRWSKTFTVYPASFIGFNKDDGVSIRELLVWSSAASRYARIVASRG